MATRIPKTAGAIQNRITKIEQELEPMQADYARLGGEIDGRLEHLRDLEKALATAKNPRVRQSGNGPRAWMHSLNWWGYTKVGLTILATLILSIFIAGLLGWLATLIPFIAPAAWAIAFAAFIMVMGFGLIITNVVGNRASK